MSFTIYARMKKPGRRMSKDLPPVPFVLDERPKTVRELLLRQNLLQYRQMGRPPLGLTELGVRDYNARKDEGQLLPFLTREEIAGQAVRGKIAFGAHSGEKADLNKAAENTVQCFLDGIYRVFAGEEELAGLEDEIPWKDGLVFTFIRLTMLSG